MSKRHNVTPSRSAIYAQQRRDNETKVRNELQDRLQSYGLDMNQELAQRGDMNMTTKTMVVALQTIDSSAELPGIVERKSHAVSSAEYNAARRENEGLVRESLRDCLPHHISSQDFMGRSDLNPTSKIIVATTKLLDELLGPLVPKRKRSKTTSPVPSLFSSDSQETDTGMSRRKSQRVTLEIPDSDEGSDCVPEDALLEERSALNIQRALSIPAMSLRSPSLVRPVDFTSPITPSSADVLLPSYHANTSTESDRLYDFLPPPIAKPRPSRCQLPSRKASSPINASHPLAQPQLWEVQSTEPHPVPQIQQLEQAAKRLVAKTKELIEPADESAKDRASGYRARSDKLSEEDEKDLEWIGDLIIDALSVVEGHATRKKVQQKWDREKTVLEMGGLLEQPHR